MTFAKLYAVRTALFASALVIPASAFAQATEWTYTDWN